MVLPYVFQTFSNTIGWAVSGISIGHRVEEESSAILRLEYVPRQIGAMMGGVADDFFGAVGFTA